MNSLVVEVDNQFGVRKWEVRFFHSGMTYQDFVFKSQNLQPDGTLACIHTPFVSRHVMVTAAKEFFRNNYDPSFTPPDCTFVPMDHRVSIPRKILRVSLVHEPTTDLYGVIRQKAFGRVKMEYLNLKTSVVEWQEAISSGPRETALQGFSMLVRGSPSFIE